MPKYRVIEPLNHNKMFYKAGSEIELKEDYAETLLEAGIVAEPEIKELPEKFDPKWTAGQLMDWGKTKHGLELDKRMKKDDIIAALETAIKQDT